MRSRVVLLGVALGFLCCHDMNQIEQSCANLRAVEHLDLWSNGWMPRGLLPPSAHSIRIRYDISTSEECGRFSFRAAELPSVKELLRPASELPEGAFHCPGGALWWPRKVAKGTDDRFEYYVMPARNDRPEIQVAIDSKRSRAYFWRPPN